MVNLLPRDVQARLAWRYYLSLAATFVFLAALAVSAGVGLLVPSYLLGRSSIESSKRYLAALEDTLGLKERGRSGEVVSELAERVSILKAYEQEPVFALVLSALGQSSRSGIAVKAIKIQQADRGKGSVAVSGVAKTRAALLAFADSLKSNSLFSGVSVPVSQLKTDTNIGFSLSFSFIQQ